MSKVLRPKLAGSAIFAIGLSPIAIIGVTGLIEGGSMAVSALMVAAYLALITYNNSIKIVLGEDRIAFYRAGMLVWHASISEAYADRTRDKLIGAFDYVSIRRRSDDVELGGISPARYATEDIAQIEEAFRTNG